jgi:hypothetical protein
MIKPMLVMKNLLAATLLLAALTVLAAPAERAATGLENAEINSGFRFRIDNLPAVQKAREAQERHTDALLKKPGIHAIGVSWAEDGSPVVKVFAEVSASAVDVPANVDGVPVVVVHTGRFFALNVDCEGRGLDNCDGIDAEAAAGTQPGSPRNWHPRPVPIGVSAGHTDVTAGTIACRVSKGCHTYALSNAHVFANGNAGQIGDPVLQPGPIDGGINPDDVIGTLYQSVPIVMGTSNSVKNRVDAAIIATDGTLVGTHTRTPGYGAPRSVTAAAQLGMNVKKYGRTTWETQAYIDILNMTVEVGYGSAGTARFVGQIVIRSPDPSTPFSAAGDSGSLIVVDGGDDDRKPVGLLFASTTDGVYTIANPIDDVLDAFAVEIDW